jgi:hypothetical protein
VSPVLNQIVGGWQINAIQTYESGLPLGVGGGGDIPLFGGGNRPNWISSNVRSSVPMSSFDPAKDLYLNIAAFSQPAPFTFGTAPPRLPTVRNPALYGELLLVPKFSCGAVAGLNSARAWRSQPRGLRWPFDLNNPATFGVISISKYSARIRWR